MPQRQEVPPENLPRRLPFLVIHEIALPEKRSTCSHAPLDFFLVIPWQTTANSRCRQRPLVCCWRPFPPSSRPHPPRGMRMYVPYIRGTILTGPPFPRRPAALSLALPLSHSVRGWVPQQTKTTKGHLPGISYQGLPQVEEGVPDGPRLPKPGQHLLPERHPAVPQLPAPAGPALAQGAVRPGKALLVFVRARYTSLPVSLSVSRCPSLDVVRSKCLKLNGSVL